MAGQYPDFGPDFTGPPANDNADPTWGDTTLPEWQGGGRGFAPPTRQPFRPRVVPPPESDSGFEAAPPRPGVIDDPTLDAARKQFNPLSLLGGTRAKLIGGLLGLLGGATFWPKSTASDDYNRSPHFSDPRLRRAFPEQRPSTVQDPYLGPAPYQTAPLGPGSPEARPSTVPDPYLGPAPYQTAPLLGPAGIGQGPFAGRPDIGAGIGQGPFAGRPDILRNGPGDRPSGVGPTYAPAVPPPRPRDQVAAQKPNLGFYTMDSAPNQDPIRGGGRRGNSAPPAFGALDLSQFFRPKDQPQ